MLDLPPMQVRWEMPKDSLTDYIVRPQFGMSIARAAGAGIVRIDVPISFRKKTNRKCKRQRCKAKRRARLRAKKRAS
jgi:hypothetical protein